MTGISAGLLVAVLHVLIVSSLGAKLLYDRATSPRVWARAVPYDPSLPIRGRYVSLQLEVEARGFPAGALAAPESVPARLSIDDGRLVATPARARSEHRVWRGGRWPGGRELDAVERHGVERLEPVEPQLAEHLGIAGGFLVAEIGAASPAARAGLKPGDIILRVGGQATTDWAELSGALQATGEAGEAREVVWIVLRDHRELSLTMAALGLGEPTREGTAILVDPVLFFIPEHVPDPSARPPGEELWVEVTLPGTGPPRPIRLGVRRDGALTPLELE